MTVDPLRVPSGIFVAELKIHDPNAAESPRYVSIWLKKYSGGLGRVCWDLSCKNIVLSSIRASTGLNPGP